VQEEANELSRQGQKNVINKSNIMIAPAITGFNLKFGHRSKILQAEEELSVALRQCRARPLLTVLSYMGLPCDLRVFPGPRYSTYARHARTRIVVEKKCTVGNRVSQWTSRTTMDALVRTVFTLSVLE
jgi:hypothetical protein